MKILLLTLIFVLSSCSYQDKEKHSYPIEKIFYSSKNIFGFENISGVGISFGFDRICMALESLNLFPKFSEKRTRILIINFGLLKNKDSVHKLCTE